ncbi:MAG: hypothetical protein R3B72_00435 [Polyangiaceae bacterium]
MRQRIVRAFGGVLVGLGLVACGGGPAVLGDWESDKRLENGEKNELELNEDYTGEAMIWATPASNPTLWTQFRFEVAWGFEGADYNFDLNCIEGPCNGDDFDMDCNVFLVDNGDGSESEKLDCEGDKKWASYPLQWERP